GARMIVKADGSTAGTIGGGAVEKKITELALEGIEGGETKVIHYKLEDLGMACGGGMSIFLEPLIAAPDLIIFGAGHIGSALSRIGSLLGFATTVVDSRDEFANRERVPWADKIVAQDYQKALQQLSFTDTSYLVILTHRHANDFEILEYCIKKPFYYLGMIGSRKKVATAFQQLREKGISEESIKRVHAPIGISIGAETPEEIAVSIAAQLVAVKSDTEITA
ncbi:MAG: XdhC/CoxI family protein, partial [Thermodesulfobacteriota bacterium]|nr:XdhC/CoxI family protein [Thermodesulfobacteriota bacterium]